MNRIILSLILSATFIFIACENESSTNPEPEPVYDDTPYIFEYGDFPPPNLPGDNPLTVEKVKLGRMLFYERKLSADGSQSCADCHRQADAFNDTARFSIGVRGMEGRRQAMSVFNMAWHDNEFFWDGRAELLRHQSLLPIQDELEMDETLDNVIAKLNESKMYRNQFIRAFGNDEITADKMSLAMEQFMLSIVSMDSKYDRYLAGEVELTESEERGRKLFFTEYNPFFPEQSGADCAHCHSGINFENDRYMNNGLDTDAEISDQGRFEVTEKPRDIGKFKVTTLRNIELTPPYMHDGRFETLDEVVEHYNSGLKMSATIDPALIQTMDKGLMLTEQDKKDLVAFLKTLTDYSLAENTEYSNPFE